MSWEEGGLALGVAAQEGKEGIMWALSAAWALSGAEGVKWGAGQEAWVCKVKG